MRKTSSKTKSYKVLKKKKSPTCTSTHLKYICAKDYSIWLSLLSILQENTTNVNITGQKLPSLGAQ